MIIIELILTTFKVIVIFLGRWGNSGNQLERKIKPTIQISTKLSLTKFDDTHCSCWVVYLNYLSGVVDLVVDPASPWPDSEQITII